MEAENYFRIQQRLKSHVVLGRLVRDTIDVDEKNGRGEIKDQ